MENDKRDSGKGNAEMPILETEVVINHDTDGYSEVVYFRDELGNKVMISAKARFTAEKEIIIG